MSRENIHDILNAIPDANLALPAAGESAEWMRPVVVTLERRIDRWTLIREALSRAGISDVTKFHAVDGATISNATRDALIDPERDIDAPPRSHLALTRPAAGCFLSHLQIWKAFLASGADHVIVLEDDAIPTASYSTALAHAIVRAVPANADLVLLGCWIMGDLVETADSGPLKRIFYFNGTFAYLLNTPGMLQSAAASCADARAHRPPDQRRADRQSGFALCLRDEAISVRSRLLDGERRLRPARRTGSSRRRARRADWFSAGNAEAYLVGQA